MNQKHRAFESRARRKSRVRDGGFDDDKRSRRPEGIGEEEEGVEVGEVRLAVPGGQDR